MQTAEMDALIAQVEALSGPDREVDAAVALAIGWTYEFNAEEDYEYWRDPDGKAEYLPRFTASLDAVLALAKRKLPGWNWGLHRLPDGTYRARGTYRAHFTKPSALRPMPTDGSDKVLTLLLALLRALRQKGGER